MNFPVFLQVFISVFIQLLCLEKTLCMIPVFEKNLDWFCGLKSLVWTFSPVCGLKYLVLDNVQSFHHWSWYELWVFQCSKTKCLEIISLSLSLFFSTVTLIMPMLISLSLSLSLSGSLSPLCCLESVTSNDLSSSSLILYFAWLSLFFISSEIFNLAIVLFNSRISIWFLFFFFIISLCSYSHFVPMSFSLFPLILCIFL